MGHPAKSKSRSFDSAEERFAQDDTALSGAWMGHPLTHPSEAWMGHPRNHSGGTARFGGRSQSTATIPMSAREAAGRTQATGIAAA